MQLILVTLLPWKASMNAELIISLLSVILARNKSVEKIHLVADNARYYKNEAVKEFLEKNPKLVFHLLSKSKLDKEALEIAAKGESGFENAITKFLKRTKLIYLQE